MANAPAAPASVTVQFATSVRRAAYSNDQRAASNPAGIQNCAVCRFQRGICTALVASRADPAASAGRASVHASGRLPRSQAASRNGSTSAPAIRLVTIWVLNATPSASHSAIRCPRCGRLCSSQPATNASTSTAQAA